MAFTFSNIALGPSPNWYFSRVSDSNKQNLVAYGARNNIVVINFETRPPAYLTVIPAHKDRVTSVSFCRYKRPNILASGSEDGIIRAWDVLKGKYFYEFHSEEKIMCISWQEGTDQVIFASTDQGSLFLLDLLHDTTTYLKCGIKSPVIVLASCPSHPNFLATGHKGGAVLILDVSQGHIIHKLKGHEDDILSLSWRPFYDDELVSTSRDRTVRIWNIVREKAINLLHIPHNSIRGGKGDEYKARPWLCTVCCPDGKLVSSTYSGNLILWDLENEKQKWEIIHTKEAGGHNKCVFNINICDPEGKKLCTVSLDRQIVIWDLELKKSELVLPTLGGFAFCLSFSPLDAGRLAIGSGDLSIRIWNMAMSGSSLTATLWQGIKGKVTAVAWHPEKEGLLAFGTEEGKIGVFDVLSSRPPTISSTFHKHTVYTVTWGPCLINQGCEFDSVSWYLYSCGGGVILIHNISQPQLDALNLDDLLSKQVGQDEKIPQRTEISWKPDFSCFAVGNDEGSIEIYHGKNFILMAHLLVQKKLIQCLCWHPLYTALSSEQSSMHMWLASASTESTVHIFDLTDILAKIPEPDSPISTITRSTRQLVGHRFRVVSLVWNPHVEGRLASASYDGTVQVWDALLGQPVANYRGHHGRVYCIEWSLIDPDVIFSGGEDCTVQRWKVSDQLHRLPPSKQEAAKQKKSLNNGSGNMIAKQKPVNGIIHDANGSLHEEFHSAEKQQNEALQKQISDVEQSACSAPIRNPDESGNFDSSSSSSHEFRTNDASHLHQDASIKIKKVDLYSFGGKKSGRGGVYLDNRKKKKTKSFFPVIAATECRGKAFAQEDCRILADYFSKTSAEKGHEETFADSISAKLGDGNWTHLGLFADQETALRMINNEANHHQEVENIEYAQQLGIWTGNIGNVINRAIEREELSDWLVSLAPLASYSLWKEACKKYASQLVKIGNYHKAVLYLLGCHELNGAIQVLKEHVSYREALALAKARLPPSDPIIQDLLNGWAVRADRDGNYELAAKCYLAKHQPMSAAKVLTKQSDPSASRLAAYIAYQCGHFAEAEAYGLSCLKDSLLKHEWPTVKEIIPEQPFLEDFKILISVHEALTVEDQKITTNPSNFGFLASPVQRNGSCNEIAFWKGYHTDNKLFLDSLLNLLDSEGYLQLENLENYKLVAAYNAIESLAVQKQTPHTAREMLFQVAVDLSLAILSSFILDKSSIMKHLAHAICTCYDASCLPILNTLFVIFIPSDIVWKFELHLDEMGKVDICDKDIESNKLHGIFSEILMIGFCEESFPYCGLLSSESIQCALVSKNLPVTALPEIFDWLEISLPENFNVFLLMSYFCINLLESMQHEVDFISACMKCFFKKISHTEDNLRNDDLKANEDTNVNTQKTELVDNQSDIQNTESLGSQADTQNAQLGDSQDEPEVTNFNSDNLFKYTETSKKDNTTTCIEIAAIEKSNESCTSNLQADQIVTNLNEKRIHDEEDNYIDTRSNQIVDTCISDNPNEFFDSLAVDTDTLDIDEINMEKETNITSNNDNAEDKNILLDIQNSEAISNMSGSDTSISNISESAQSVHNSGISPLMAGGDIHCDLNEISDTYDAMVKSYNGSVPPVEESQKPYIETFTPLDNCSSGKPHLRCFQDCGLYFYLLQKCHMFLLCDVFALYFSLKDKLKDIEITLASRKAIERITENSQTNKVLPLATPLNSTFENGNDIDNSIGLASENETNLFSLQEEYHAIAFHIKKLEEKAKGVTIPNPVSSAVKLIVLYQKLLETCSCEGLCSLLQERSSSAAKWAIQFAANEDDIKILKAVL